MVIIVFYYFIRVAFLIKIKNNLNFSYFREFQIAVEPQSTKVDDINNRRFPANSSYTAGIVYKAEVEEQTVIFVVGSGKEEKNPRLLDGEKYQIYVGSCSVVRTVCVF